jgi:Vitamin K-dependent gamma-carboxylase
VAGSPRLTVPGSTLDAFLFSRVDSQAAAWYRIVFAAAIPLFFASNSMNVPTWASGQTASLYDNLFLTWGYTALIAVMCVLLAIGWNPRAVALVLVVMLVPLCFLDMGRPSRQVMLFALFCFSFVRSDAIRLPWSAEHSAVQDAGPAWPVRLIQLQLTALYLVNAIAKSSPQYLSGDALRDMSAELPNFQIDLSAGVFPFGPLAVPVALAAAGSALMEYFLATAFWARRLRWVAAISGIVFHFVLTRIVKIHMLDYAAIFLYLAFLLPLIKPVRSAPGRSSPQLSGRRQDLPAPREASPATQP